MTLTVVVLVLAVALAVGAEWRVAAANPDRVLRFHWRRPQAPVELPRAAMALQGLAIACLTVPALRWADFARPRWLLL